MPKVAPAQTDFSAGEISSLCYARTDLKRTQSAAALIENYVPIVQGPLVRRPGTKFINKVKEGSEAVRLVPFVFSIGQEYVLEFGYTDDSGGYIRFYKNQALILTETNEIYEITHPYGKRDIGDIHFNQSNDMIFVCHPRHPVRTLSRYGHTSWSWGDFNFYLGPWQMIHPSDGVYMNPQADINFAGTNIINNANIIKYYTDYNYLSLTKHPNGSYRLYSGTLLAERAGQWSINVANYLVRIIMPDTRLKDGEYVKIRNANLSIGYGVNGIHKVRRMDSLNLSGYNGVDDPEKQYWLENNYVNVYFHSLGDFPVILRPFFTEAWIGKKVRLVLGSNIFVVRIDSLYDQAEARITILEGEERYSSLSVAEKTTTRWYMQAADAGEMKYGVSCFHENRLWFSGNLNYPQRVDGSAVGDYTDFSPTQPDGTLTASNAVSFVLNSQDTNVVKWMVSDEKGLLIGTTGNEWVVGGSNNQAISPTNIMARKVTTYGSENNKAVQIGKSVMYVQRFGKILRELMFFYDVDGFKSNNLNTLAEHITESGIKDFAYQQQPHSILWVLLNNGKLIAMTYERDSDALRVAWQRHSLGGSKVTIEGLTSIPAFNRNGDEVWFVLKRRINGRYEKYVECMSSFFDEYALPENAFFVDSGLTYEKTVKIRSVEPRPDGLFKAHTIGDEDLSALISVGSRLYLDHSDLSEMSKKAILIVKYVSTGPFSFSFEAEGPFNLGENSYLNYPTVGVLTNKVLGLEHLEKEKVSICADGAALADQIVREGKLEFNSFHRKITVGLGYKSRLKMLRIDMGSADGTAIGKTRRTNKIGITLNRSLGLRVGTNFDRMYDLIFRNTADPLGRSVPLFTGIISESLDADYDFDNNICIEQEQPLPSTLVAVYPQMVVQD